MPFAGVGALKTRQVYPITLGANIGTTITAIIAAFAVEGDNAEIALQIALVGLLFNLAAVVIIYGIPFLREIPPRCAEFLASIGYKRKGLAVAWVVTLFIVIPGLTILIYALVIF